MTKENIISIYNNILEEIKVRPSNDPITYHRFRSCNAYIADELIDVQDDTDGTIHSVRLIKSYDTIVAFYDYDNDVFCEIGKFSPTTSKQCTQIYNQEFRNSERINAMHIKW